MDSVNPDENVGRACNNQNMLQLTVQIIVFCNCLKRKGVNYRSCCLALGHTGLIRYIAKDIPTMVNLSFYSAEIYLGLYCAPSLPFLSKTDRCDMKERKEERKRGGGCSEAVISRKLIERFL